jgi:hypothetical protein
VNGVDARSRPVYGGYLGEFRKVHKADWEAVCVNGVPQVFPTAEAAEIAAWRALRAHLCADIVGGGEKASSALSEAEERFKKLFPGHGRKPVDVVRR